MLAIVRVRGTRKMLPKIDKTLALLRLHKPNHCVLVPDNVYYKGMLKIIKDYVTFGEVDEKMLFKLLYGKGKKGANFIHETADRKALEAAVKEIAAGKKKVAEVVDPVFCLHPPRKGYKNTKMQYPLGALGRRDDMAALLNRMI